MDTEEIRVITVEKLLKKLKVLEKRITKKQNEFFVVGIQKGKNSCIKESVQIDNKIRIKSYSLSDYESLLNSQFQSLSDLIQYRNHLNSALIQSNSTTTIEFNGNTLTIIQALSLKDSYHLDSQFLSHLRSQYASKLQQITKQNRFLPQKLSNLLQQTYSTTDDSMLTESQINSISIPFLFNNESSLVDPLNTSLLISQLESNLKASLTELSSKIHTSNQQTTVQITHYESQLVK